jgi:DNA-binding GntR family transcriptional regulator
MTSLFVTHQEPTLTEQAYRRLEEMIVTLELSPGSAVSEAVLSTQIGIGTTPVREALQRLARHYLVQIFARRGVVITAVDVNQQLQILETRRELERLVARLASRRATDEEREALVLLAEHFEAIGASVQELRVFLRCDAELNARMVTLARNPIAGDALLALHPSSRRFWFFHHRNGRSGQPTAKVHAVLARAIAAGSETQALDACEALISEAVEFAKGTLAL